MSIMTSADVIKINNSEEIVGVISEVIQSIPELAFFGASPVTRNSYKTLCVTSAPTVGFKSPGADRVFSTATLANKTIDLRYLDASWLVSCSIAKASDWGVETALAIQQKEHLKAALFKIAEQTWKGAYNSSTNPGFDGFNGVISTANVAVVDANPGTALSDGSCVYAVRTGLDSAQYAWGNGGKLDEGDIVEQLITSKTSGGDLQGEWYYTQNLGGWCGLQITSKWAGGMIKNLSATGSNKGLSDELIYDLISKFPVDATPTALFMNRRSLAQLRKSREAVSYTGVPTPIPTEAAGLPIYVTDAIGSTDTVAS